jgi:pimeloyl-ACP methyl ester carboxylesterase
VRVDEHTTEVAGSPAFYRSAPSAGTPALYLHGVPTSSDDWIELLERSGGVAPDLPGFGRSGKAGNLDYTIGGQVDYLERLLSAIGIARVNLVLHDWGAASGLGFAQRHPERVDRIVLFNPLPLLPGFRWYGHARAWRAPVVGELLMGSTSRRLIARALRRASVSADVWTDERVAAVWEQFDQGTQRAILRLHRATDETALQAAGARLGQLDAPALIVWGDRDPWLGPELATAYAQTLPNATVEHLADAGHWPWLDRPDVADRVIAFLEQHP